jgi:hypothetical protein
MRHLNPAMVQAELPEIPGGIPFLDGIGERRCLWPLSGAGADMLVCGARRADRPYPYCADHYALAVNPRATHGVQV